MTASVDPQQLLRPGEQVPVAVQRIVDFLHGHGIWFALSRNHPADGCKDAAHKRDRLGHIGIPLYDELKTSFCRFEDEHGNQRVVLIHCRGDELLASERVAQALNARGDVVRLSQNEIDTFGVARGLVNPFIPYKMDGQALVSGVFQIFDPSVLSRMGLPGTMMTNAGDLTWGLEFRPEDLFEKIPNARRASVSVLDPDAPRRPIAATRRPILGIITGNAPESGAQLWLGINDRLRAAQGDDSHGDIDLPRVKTDSVPDLGDSMELDIRSQDVWKALQDSVTSMCTSGVDILTLACNTTSVFAEQIRGICDAYGTEFVSMPEVVGEYLRSSGIDDVALMGIRSVIDLDGQSAYGPALNGVHVELPDASLVGAIEELAYQVKSEGADHSGLDKLRRLLARGLESDHIVIALTELSILLQTQKTPGKSGKVLIDPLQLYADAIADRFLAVEPPSPDVSPPLTLRQGPAARSVQASGGGLIL